MKKLEWNFEQNDRDLTPEDLSLFIEKSNKSNNLWWSGLNKYKNHLHYFKQYAKEFFNSQRPDMLPRFDGNYTPKSAVTCPAIGKGILDKCLILKFPCDVMFSMNHDGNWVHNASDEQMILVESHNYEQYQSTEDIFRNKVNIKFALPIMLLSKNNPYIFLQPQYHKKEHPFEIMNGVVDQKTSQTIAVNTFIDMPREQQSFQIKKDTVLAYIWFAEDFKMDYNPKLTHRRCSFKK